MRYIDRSTYNGRFKKEGFRYIEKLPTDKLEECKGIFEALYEKLLSL